MTHRTRGHNVLLRHADDKVQGLFQSRRRCNDLLQFDIYRPSCSAPRQILKRYYPSRYGRGCACCSLQYTCCRLKIHRRLDPVPFAGVRPMTYESEMVVLESCTASFAHILQASYLLHALLWHIDHGPSSCSFSAQALQTSNLEIGVQCTHSIPGVP